MMLRRLTNGLRKLGAGLRPFSESVWPGVRNDLFVAHESIYEFFARHVAGEHVLDAGCGTGYGARRLLDAGAASVIGVDLDPFNVRYATRHYAAPGLTFERGDIQRLRFADESFGVVTASNSLEHLDDPAAFLKSLRRMLTRNGKALIAVPPIHNAADAQVHAHIHYHRSNLSIGEWLALFDGAGFGVDCFAHHCTGGTPDFASREPSTLTTRDFTITPADLRAAPSITAIFALRVRGG